MARYRYTAVDREGKPVSGEIEATGLDEARIKLALLGFSAQEAQLEPLSAPAPRGGHLSATEATQLGGEIAGVAKAGLPLGSGLRAAAQELPARRLQAVLRRIADRIDAGAALEAAVEAEGPRVPAHLRCIVAAAVRSGRFAEVADQLVAVERMRIDAARRLRLTLAYPALLMAVIVAIYMLFSLGVVPRFRSLFADFGADPPPITNFMLAVCSPLGAAVLVVLGLAVAGAGVVLGNGRSRVAWFQNILYGVPLVGPCWRFRGLAEFSRLMGLLVDLKVPLPQALRAVGDGLREGDLRQACHALAGSVEAGISLSEAMKHLRAFPATFVPLVQWGQQAANLAEAFRATAEISEGRLRFQSFFMGAVILPLALVVVVAFVIFFSGGLLLPLVSLIQKLS